MVISRESKKYLYRGLCNTGLLLVSWLIFVWAWYIKLNSVMPVMFLGKGNYLMSAVYGILLILCLYVMKAYGLCVERVTIVCLSVGISLFLNNALNSFIFMLMVGDIAKCAPIAGYFLLMCLLQILCSIIFALVATSVYIRSFPPHRILHLMGNYENNLEPKMNNRSDKYHIEKTIHMSEYSLDEVLSMIDNYDAVLLNDLSGELRNRILKYCYQIDKRVYITPKISDIILRKSRDLSLFDSPLWLCRNRGLTLSQKLWKRASDIVISLSLLIILSPIMLLTAIAIKLDDGGPVFYKQLRYTIYKHKFWILKFRSMIVNAEADGKANPAASDDSRITRVGRFIRATRIDELPQLINILKGEMSFVGPRAERIEHVDKYIEQIPEFAYRMKVKAGLTGYAQIYGKYNTTPYDKIKLDMIYIMNYSLLMDLQIIALTLKVIFMKESTEGFDDKQRETITMINNKKVR